MEWEKIGFVVKVKGGHLDGWGRTSVGLIESAGALCYVVGSSGTYSVYQVLLINSYVWSRYRALPAPYV